MRTWYSHDGIGFFLVGRKGLEETREEGDGVGMEKYDGPTKKLSLLKRGVAHIAVWAT